MSTIIVYTYEGQTIISNPAPGVDPQTIISKLPAEVVDATILTTDDLPANRNYSDSWTLTNGIIEIDMTIARETHIDLLNEQISQLISTLIEFRTKVQSANKDTTTINTRINYLRTFTSDPRIAAATTIDELISIEPVDWDYPSIDDLPTEQYSNDPRLTVQNIVKVKKNPGSGEYSTISSALASITDSNINNRYLVLVGPGVYIETVLTIPEYTTISGNSSNAVIVTPYAADQYLFVCSNYSEIEFITMAGHEDSLTTGSEYEAVRCLDSGTVKINNVIITGFNIGIKQHSLNTESILYCSHVNISGNYEYGFHNTTIPSSNGNKSIMNLMNLDLYQTGTTTSHRCIYNSGSDAEIYIQSSSFTGGLAGPDTGSIGIIALSGILDIVGSLFYDMQGILTDTALDITDIGPFLKVSGSIFNGCEYDFDIRNPNTTGYYIGFSIKENYRIHADSLFFIANENSNVLTVSKSGSNFTSVKDALDSITNSSDTNIYTVVIGSGTFEEEEMTIPQYTSIMGATINSTFIKCKTANQNLFNMGTYCEISFLSMEGHENSIGTGYAAVKCTNVGDFAQMHKISIFGFDIGIEQLASTIDTYLYIEYVDVNESGLYDIKNVSQNGFEAFIQLENFYGYQSSSSLRNGVLSEGSNSNMKLHVAGFIGGEDPQKGIILQNGGHCDIGATFFQDLECGIYVPNTGSGPNIQIEGTTFMNCTHDFNILNTGATGYFFGYSKRTSYSIVTGSAFFIADQDAKLVRVAKRGGDFTSIKNAVDSITDSSFYNPYMVMIGPGLYFEYGIQMKTGIFLMGSINGSVVIVPPIATETIIYGAEWSMIKDLVLSGAAGPGGRAVYHQGTAGDGFLIRDCAFTQNETNVHIHGTDVLTVCVVDRCITSGNVGYAHKCTNENDCPTRLTLLNLLYQDLVQPVCQYFAYASGPGTIINSMNCMLNIIPTSGATGFKIENGAYVNMSGTSFKGFGKAIHVTSVGAAPSLYTSQTLIHNSVDYDLLIENELTEGLFQGFTNYNKTSIPKNCPFNIYLKDQNVISVMKKGGDFTSIKSAVDSVTDSATDNRYVINVGAGIFTEETITMKPYVYINGSNNATKISPVTRNQHLVVGSKYSKVSNVLLSGIVNDTSETYSAIYHCDNTGASNNFFLAENISFGSNDTNVIVESITSDKYSVINLVNCSCGHGSKFNTGFIAISVVSSTSILNINQLSCLEQSEPKPSYFVKGSGPSTIILSNVITKTAELTPTTYSYFSYIENGANLHMNSVIIDTWDTGIYVSDVGKASNVNISSTMFLNNTTDINIQHQGTTGIVNSSLTKDKVISVTTNVKMFINDISNNGYTFSGPFNYSKQNYQDTTDISSLIMDNAPLTILEGGTISSTTSLTISVTSGYGYMLDSNSSPKLYEWSFTTLSVTTTSSNLYIYINNNGLITYDSIEPDSKSNLIFGSLYLNDNSIKHINNLTNDTSNTTNNKHITNNIIDYLYDISPIYLSGSLISVSSRSLSITSGSLYNGPHKINISSNSLITFEQYGHNSGSFISVSTSSLVSNDTYDNGTDLISLTTGYFTRHLLLQSISNDQASYQGSYIMIYGQTQSFTTYGIPLPSVPNYIQDSKSYVSIASLIVDPLSDDIIVVDERPLYNRTNRDSNGASNGYNGNVHGNLTGLNDDDHPQYLLANGSRNLSGNLNVGNNNITNATLINGIDILNHASRHAFNGSDPLDPATTMDIMELSDSVADGGSVNTRIPRADHVHAHGNRGGGSLHAIATTSVAGFMSYLDKVKLDSIDSGATNTQLSDAIPVNVTKSSASVGTSEYVSRADHKHDISTGAPTTTLTSSTTNSEGASTSISRADHTHAISTAVPITQNPDQSNAIGASSSLARADHVHEIKTAAAVSISGNTTNTVGAADTFSRSNHTHEILTGIPVIQTIAAVALEGSSADLARADHVHVFETGTARTVGTANSEGTAVSFSRSDHVHSHGQQLGGLLHAVATTSVAGFMSGSDKSKLDLVASGATKNDYFYASGSSTFNFSGSSSATISGMSLLPGAGSYLATFNASISSPSTSYLHTFSIFVNGSEVSSTIRYQNIHDTEIININVVITGILADQYVEMKVHSTGNGSVYNRSFVLIRI